MRNMTGASRAGRLICGMILVGTLMVFPVACSKEEPPENTAADEVAEKVMETAFKVDGQDVQVEIDSEAGTLSVKGGDETGDVVISGGKKTKLPADFPKDVPLYPGLAMNMSTKQSQDNAYVVAGTTADPVEKVESFYRSKLEANNWTEEKIPFQMQGVAMLIFKKGGRMASINVSNPAGTTQIVVTVAEE